MAKSTFEMDGLFTQEDIDNRFKVMKQCRNCRGWTQQNTQRKDDPCMHCGGNELDHHSTTSLRTYDPVTAKKRKIK